MDGLAVAVKATMGTCNEKNRRKSPRALNIF